jgi:hypothetical protein
MAALVWCSLNRWAFYRRKKRKRSFISVSSVSSCSSYVHSICEQQTRRFSLAPSGPRNAPGPQQRPGLDVQAAFDRYEATPMRPSSHSKATSKPYTRQPIGNPKPPQSHPHATSKRPQSHTKATPKPHQSLGAGITSLPKALAIMRIAGTGACNPSLARARVRGLRGRSTLSHSGPSLCPERSPDCRREAWHTRPPQSGRRGPIAEQVLTWGKFNPDWGRGKCKSVSAACRRRRHI